MIRLSSAEARAYESWAKKESKKAKPRVVFTKSPAIPFNAQLPKAVKYVVQRENGTVIEKYRNEK